MKRLIQKFKTDVLALVYFGAGVFLAFALGTYHPKDPSLNSMNWSKGVENACGIAGSFLADSLFQLLGLASFLLPAVLFLLAWRDLLGGKFRVTGLKAGVGTCLILTGAALLNHYIPETRFFAGEIRAGGIAGLGIHHLLVGAFNPVGAQIVLWVSFGVFLVFALEKTLQEILHHPGILGRHMLAGLASFGSGFGELFRREPEEPTLKVSKRKTKPEIYQSPASEEVVKKSLFKRKAKVEEEIEEDEEENEEFVSESAPRLEKAEQLSFLPVIREKSEEARAPERRKVVEKVKVVRQIENWELPKISLIEDPPASRVKIDEREIRRKADLLKEKLGHFSVRGDVVAAKPGPVVTMFEFKPDADVKLSKITELADDLSLALSSESLRIIAPIPGRDVVGIETANAQREAVYLKDMLAEEDFWKDDIKLPIALGKQANGDPRIVDLRKMPHLMVAGTTGSGKSVFTVSTITGLLFRHSPKTLRIILIDPKQVDLAAFDSVPHLLMPVITDTHKAVMALKWAVREMEKRYKSMSEFGARGLEDFNKNVADLTKEQKIEHEKINNELEQTPGKKGDCYYFEPQPYITIVVEEFADLMVTDKGNVETSVVRLAQKARACGIHLMICMQSPRKEVVTGLIRTNFSSRIAFKVADAMESRIILDGAGAERLLAQGDMLFKGMGSSSMVRNHGPFLKDGDISAVTKFWAAQGEPQFDSKIIGALEANPDLGSSEAGEGGESSGADYDERYDEILAWASTQKEVSASLIQRRFQLGYPRAARLIECFEREGVVGPANGSKPRQVLIGAIGSMQA